MHVLTRDASAREIAALKQVMCAPGDPNIAISIMCLRQNLQDVAVLRTARMRRQTDEEAEQAAVTAKVLVCARA